METQESNFTIRVLINDRNYRLDVVPGCDGKPLASYFTLCEGAVVVAVIHKSADGNWEWIEGGFNQQPASFVGEALEKHLSEE